MTTDEIMALVGEYAESNRRWEGPDSFTYVKLRSTIEALQADAARYRWLRNASKEVLLRPERAGYEILPDLRTHWQMPFLMCSGPVGGFVDFDAAIDAAMGIDKP